MLKIPCWNFNLNFCSRGTPIFDEYTIGISIEKTDPFFDILYAIARCKILYIFNSNTIISNYNY